MNNFHFASRLKSLNPDPPMVYKFISRTRHLMLVLDLDDCIDSTYWTLSPPSMNSLYTPGVATSIEAEFPLPLVFSSYCIRYVLDMYEVFAN